MSMTADRSTPHMQAEQWFARLRSQPGDGELLAEFNQWHAASPANAVAYASVQELWSGLEALADDPELLAALHEAQADIADDHQADGDAPALPDYIAPPRPQRVTPVRPRRHGWRAVALAAGIAALALPLAWHLRPPAASGWEDYRTGHGEQRTVALDDGSTLTLDTDTELRVRMQPHLRELQLRHGVAMFDVHHDPARPMTVALPGGRIRDIGTLFQASVEDRRAEVTLVHGSVSVERDTPARAQRLSPGESLTFDGSHWISRRLDETALAELADWTDGRLSFHAATLDTVIAQLNRYGPRQVRLADPALGKLQVSGVLEIGQQDSFVLGLQRVLPLHASVDHDQVVLSAQ